MKKNHLEKQGVQFIRRLTKKLVYYNMIGKEFKSIVQLINAFPTQESCIEYLEKIIWDGNPISPFDKTSKVYNCKGSRYKCKNSGKYFNVLHGTIFENAKIPLQTWFLAIWMITSHKKGVSSMQLSRDINVTQKTAWFMLQRIRNCFKEDKNEILENEVEVDESFIGGKNKNRHAHKKVKNSQGRSLKDKTPVFGMIERGGEVKARVVKNTTAKTLLAEIEKSIAKGATIYSDEWKAYNNLHKIYDHDYVKHNLGEYVRGCVHTNTIEGFWSLLKRAIIGTYHSVSPKHLQKYVNEMSYCYRSCLNFFD